MAARRSSAPTLPRQSERDFQAAVVKLAKLLGWRCYWTHNSLHSPNGWPDLVCIRRPRILFLELKAERTPVTPAQAETIAELQACEQAAFIVRPEDWPEIERLLR